MLVEISGIEPLTSWMPFKRSPSWAIPPFSCCPVPWDECYNIRLLPVCQLFFSIFSFFLFYGFLPTKELRFAAAARNSVPQRFADPPLLPCSDQTDRIEVYTAGFFTNRFSDGIVCMILRSKLERRPWNASDLYSIFFQQQISDRFAVQLSFPAARSFGAPI